MSKIPPAVITDLNFGEEWSGITDGYPVDAHCDGGGCDNAVVWFMDFHGCWHELLCQSHASNWVDILKIRVKDFGSVECNACGKDFPSVDDVATVRAI